MCDACPYEEVKEEIEEMIENPRYEFALDTLRGIYEWVDANDHVTEKQQEAVANIKEST